MGQDKNCKERCSSGTRRSDPCWDEPLALNKWTTGVEIGVPESLAVARSCKQLHVLGSTCSKRFISSSTAANSFSATCSKTDAPHPERHSSPFLSGLFRRALRRGGSRLFHQPSATRQADCFQRLGQGLRCESSRYLRESRRIIPSLGIPHRMRGKVSGDHRRMGVSLECHESIGVILSLSIPHPIGMRGQASGDHRWMGVSPRRHGRIGVLQ